MSVSEEKPRLKNKRSATRALLATGALLLAGNSALDINDAPDKTSIRISNQIKTSIDGALQPPKVLKTPDAGAEKIQGDLKESLLNGVIDYDFIRNDFMSDKTPEDLAQMEYSEALQWISDNYQRQLKIEELAEENKIDIGEVVHLKLISPARALEKIRKFEENGEAFLNYEGAQPKITPGNALRLVKQMKVDNVGFFNHVYKENSNYPQKPSRRPIDL